MGTLYLIHHGIDGQKWGVKNGPPYPLSEGARSAKEVRLNGKVSKSGKKKKKLSANQKRAITAGVATAITGTASVAGGVAGGVAAGKALNKASDGKLDTSAGVAAVNALANNTKSALSTASGLVDTIDKANRPKYSYSHISDEELKKRVNRLNLEQNYARLTGAESTSKGAQWAKNALEIAGSVVTIAGGAAMIYIALKGKVAP